MHRKKAREKALQILFQIDIAMESAGDVIDQRFELDQIDQNQREFIRQIVEGTRQHLQEIDLHLERVLEGWNLQRIGKVEKNILRMAVYELTYTDLSASIVINEAVDLAKIFSTNQSAGFINGILAKIIKENDGGAKD